MFSMRDKSLELARILRKDCELLVAGGPLPTTNPEAFLQDFDVTVIGEGEQTMLELARLVSEGNLKNISQVQGITYKNNNQIIQTPDRPFIQDIDSLPHPAHHHFDTNMYKLFGVNYMPIITSRGCPSAAFPLSATCHSALLRDDTRCRPSSRTGLYCHNLPRD